jgi:PPOX class probable F420-dependent enzyme
VTSPGSGGRRRFAEARHAYLGTADASGVPHLVPVTFALLPDVPDTLVIAIDHKPKRTHDLRRLRNIAANPEVTMLVDHFEEDWSRLWWVRADGTATILHDPDRDAPLDHLAAKYPPYRIQRPTGPVISIAVHTWRTWSATPPPKP